ncbi:MAG: LacI family DNA-binding transcriptional regulator [Phycisphaerales bacterium]|nr:LacI family DNA-binding transcriptional regulator [Phycisphaerales bacterium]
MRVTLKDIAAKVGVDPSAVSLALSDRTAGKLSPQRVRQIREVAASIGYRPNLSATHLARGKTMCIGVVLSYLDCYPYNYYFNLISEACDQAGYHAVPLAVGRRSLFEESSLNLGRVHVDGMIVLDYQPADDGADLSARLAGYPLVVRMTDPKLPRPNFPCVLVDYYEGICELLRHVIGRGWRKFMFIAEDDPTRPQLRNHGRLLADHEERAIRDTSQAMGVPMDFDHAMIRTPERGAKARYDAMMAYLSNHRIEKGVCLIQDGADGVSGTYAALTRMGYVVGQDLTVVTMGAIPAWEHVEPLPTFTCERFQEISRLMVELALDGIEQKHRFSRQAQFTYAATLHDFDAVTDVTKQPKQ